MSTSQRTFVIPIESDARRKPAYEKLLPFIQFVEQYAAVALDHACQILGIVVYHRMMTNPIRCLGPNGESVYPWNVVDYMVNPELE